VVIVLIGGNSTDEIAAIQPVAEWRIECQMNEIAMSTLKFVEYVSYLASTRSVFCAADSRLAFQDSTFRHGK